ncbi:MAG TPA: hypothetical protein VHD36_03175 [Pirellulales bacterium]|nr:hypothetical protein [Pirellulales bacterium]
MDGVRISVALAPLTLYLLLLAWLNLLRRPVLVTGTRDIAALGFGISGMLLVGPIELLHPISAVNQLGPYIWVLSVGLYSLSLALWILFARPRLTVYNISVDQLRPLLATAIEGLDSQYRWAGTCLSLPNLDVQLHLESNGLMRNVSLVANGDRQNPAGWRQLELALAQQLVPAQARPNVWGPGLSVAALLMGAVVAWYAPLSHTIVIAALRDMLPF